MSRCEHCGIKDEEEKVFCWGCMNPVHKKKCNFLHWCGVLTTKDGHAVGVGNVLVYPDNNRIYRVTETPGTFVKGGTCYGVKKVGKGWDQEQTVIRPRLMLLME